MKVAVVHDWLQTYGGAERTLREILACYPEADLYSVVDFLPDAQRALIGDKRAHTSFIQRLPFARTRFRDYLLWMPLAVEQFDLSRYDLVISSSHAVAKGVLTDSHQLHVCYCHTPMRYAWHMPHQYLRESGLEHGLRGWIARWMLHRLRIWDARTGAGVDEFVANSLHVARRIRKVYGRESRVIHPPVDVDSCPYQERKEEFYLTVSRITPYKGVTEIVSAFREMPGRKLVVIGGGPLLEKVRGLAGPNTAVLGYQDEAVVRDHMRRAKAFVFAADEDFGIAPVEAQGCGTPVIALAKGGVLESMREAPGAPPSALFFPEATPEAIRRAVEEFEAAPGRLTPAACRANALRFETRRFRAEFSEFVDGAYRRFRAQFGSESGAAPE